jgi:hypothetical protein
MTLGLGYSSRQGAKTLSKTRCHFDRREKSFLDPSHSLGMTGLGPSPLRLGVFAGDIPISFFAFFAPFAVNYPIPNLLWLRLRHARLSVVNSESQRAAALARIGGAGESAGLGMNHDHMRTTKTLRIAADHFMASSRQFVFHRLCKFRLQTHLR